MSSKPSLFKETDIKRAFQAAKLAGVDVARVEIDRSGKISIVLRSEVAGRDIAPTKAPVDMPLPEPWD